MFYVSHPRSECVLAVINHLSATFADDESIRRIPGFDPVWGISAGLLHAAIHYIAESRSFQYCTVRPGFRRAVLAYIRHYTNLSDIANRQCGSLP